MKCNLMLTITVFICAASLLLDHVTARPYNSLSDKDREDILHYAAKIVRIALGDEAAAMPGSSANKRNSGMLDAVINMPDLFRAGK